MRELILEEYIGRLRNMSYFPQRLPFENRRAERHHSPEQPLLCSSLQIHSLDRADAFWRALDVVARERHYILHKKGPPIEQTKEFVKKIVEKGVVDQE